MELRLKELMPQREREYAEVVYTPESIRELWSEDTPDKSLVLALLEKWEQEKARADEMKNALIEALQIAWRRGRGDFRPIDGEMLAELEKLANA